MSNEIVRYVGLDVHKRVVEACIVDQAGNVVRRQRFALNRLSLALFATKILRPADHVALEATTNCWAVADALQPHVAKVLVSNPMATKAIAQAKVKTDKVDAHVLAQLLRCDFLPEVWQPDEATRRLRAEGYIGPIIALTAHAMKEDMQSCLDAGCNGYLSKPIEREKFLSAVAGYLSARAAESRAVGPPPAPAAASQGLP